MSRAERLLELLQCLRHHKYPVSGADLAAELGISLRTVYRDILSLQAQGAHIEGERGVGYVLRPGFTLPPLMFSEDEIEAIALGTRWVADRTDSSLGSAARNALTKISAVLPADLRRKMEASTLLVGSYEREVFDEQDFLVIRKAIRSEHKVSITYRDEKGNESTRIIWPFALGFFERVQLVLAWCELRQGFRHFRADRLIGVTLQEEIYPRRRHVLLREWELEDNASRKKPPAPDKI